MHSHTRLMFKCCCLFRLFRDSNSTHMSKWATFRSTNQNNTRSHTNQTAATMASAAPSPAASASKPQAGTQSSKRSGKQAKKKTRGGIERACKVDSGDSSPVCRRYVVQFTFDHLEHALPEFDAILRALGVDADSCYEQYVYSD